MALNSNETYISVEDAIEYANLMGLELPQDEETLEPLLRRAAIYLDRIYGSRFAGDRLDVNQFLEWPRDSYYGVGMTVPKNIGYAQVELAVILNTNGGELPQVAPRLTKRTVKLEGLETSVEFAGTNGYAVDPYERIAMALGPWLNLSGAGGFARKLTMTRGG